MSRTTADSDQGSWPAILLIYAICVLGAATVSQAIAVTGDLARTFHIAGQQIGWIISLPSALIGIGALAAGWLVDRLNDKRMMLAGCIVVIAGDIGVTFAESVPILLAMRAVEGAGNVAIHVAGVTMITRITQGQRRNSALTLWSTFIPMSFILPLALASKLAGTGLWAWAFSGHAIALAVLGILALAILPGRQRVALPSHSGGIGRVVKSPGPYLLGLAFAATAFVQTGIVSILPQFLVASYGISLAAAASIGSLGLLFNVAGCLAVGPLLNRGIKPLTLYGIGAPVMVLAGIALGSLRGGLVTAIVVGFVFFSGTGLLAGMWALLPRVSPDRNAQGATSGLVTQITLWGVLFGPPAAFAALAGGDWTRESANLVLAGAISLVSAWLVIKRFGPTTTGGDAQAAAQTVHSL